MASSGGIWGPAALRLLRTAVATTSRAIHNTVAEATKPLQKELLQPAPIRHATPSPSSLPSPSSHRLPTTSFLGLGRTEARWFSSSPSPQASANHISLVVRRCISSSEADRSNALLAGLKGTSQSQSQTARRVAQLPGSSRSPFASTLRPNLTGGVLPRTAGGYGLGAGALSSAAGARYFSHTPAAPAQVVDNVSQALRAFFSSGRRIQYDGLGHRGDPQYRAVSAVEDAAVRKLASNPHFAPGAHIDFHLSPTITALGPLAAAVVASGQYPFDDRATVFPSLHTEGFLDVLSADFGRALKDLTAIFGDLRRLSALGDLPIALEGGNVLRVRFPGVDKDMVECLCEDVGIQRGVIGQDRDLQMDIGAELALRMPFAPDVLGTPTAPGTLNDSQLSFGAQEWQEVPSLGDESFVHEAFAHGTEGSMLSRPSPWASEVDSSYRSTPSLRSQEGQQSSEEYEALEGIYRFLKECDRAKGRLG